ncbi:MAG: N-6 DNA methylase [Promethearchaeota archaeon]
MNYDLIKNLDRDFDFDCINKKIKDLEVLLSQNEIHSNIQYNEWLNDFKRIYGEIGTNLRLYIQYALIYFIGILFISNFIFQEDIRQLNIENLLKELKKSEDHIKSTFNAQEIINFEYFNPLFSLSEKIDLSIFSKIILNTSTYLFELDINPVYIFDYIFQKIISPIIRHKKGEYYTPPFLVKKMVNKSYSIGETVLDPCCGSGNFLVGILLKIFSNNIDKDVKIDAINKIWGFDINPISIYLSKINILFLTKDLNSKIKLNLYVNDFLFNKKKELKDKFDLVIGNPPWYTYRDVESKDYQESLKFLAERLEIKPRPKNILNMEVSTLFFCNAIYYMKNNAKIFFVITKGVITGSHASRFRYFKDFSEIKIWLFDKELEKIFNIDFICLYAHKTLNVEKGIQYKIPTYHFILKNNDADKEITLILKKKDVFVPFSIEEYGEKIYIKKLISPEKMENLLPLGVSFYKGLFHKGADLNPRNLIFVSEQFVNDSLVKINPDDRIFKQSKIPWNKREFENEIIEKKYIFKVVKSTELVKFSVYDSYNVFLPLSKNDLSFTYENLDQNARNFYGKINKIYLKYKKETTTHNSIMENLNRWSKLINPRQLSKIKVVYNNSGSIINSAVIQGNFIITGDLSFFDTPNLDEAYYLSAVLNSNILTEQIKIMKSSRHIFKLPFNVPIKKYDTENFNHRQLAKLSKKGHEIALSSISNILINNKEKASKIKIQKILNKELKLILNQIDEFVIKELNPH